jgi:hypothetical protein
VSYRNLFTISMDIEGVSVDALHTIDMDRLMAARAKAKIIDTVDPYESEVNHTYMAISLRARFGSNGEMYNLHTGSPLTRGELETLLQYEQRNGTLRRFLTKARI